MTPETGGLWGRPTLRDRQPRLSWAPSSQPVPPRLHHRFSDVHKILMCCPQAQWAFQRSRSQAGMSLCGGFCPSKGSPPPHPRPTLTLYSLRLLSLQNTHIHIQCGFKIKYISYKYVHHGIIQGRPKRQTGVCLFKYRGINNCTWAVKYRVA